VGFYASLINVNAYHQPGVEAGKKAAAAIIELELKLLGYLKSDPTPKSISEIAQGIDAPDRLESIFKICEHLTANPDRRIKKIVAKSPFESRYAFA
jgi:glucose-6-phosphate isomerase